MTWDRFFEELLPPIKSLTVALLPIAAALITLMFTQQHARKLAAAERASRSADAAKTRAFDARQQRYGDRRDAIVEFLAAVQKEEDNIDEYYRDPWTAGTDPVDLAEDYAFVRLYTKHAQLVLLADSDVVESADAVVDGLKGVFHGRDGAWETFASGKRDLLVNGRKMLVADAEESA